MGPVTNLIPRPRNLTETGEVFPISDATHVIADTGGSAKAAFAAERLAELVREEFGLVLKVEERRAGPPYRIALSDQSDVSDLSGASAPSALSDEGYTLEATTVFSPTPQGLLWGAMTLRQLLFRDQRGVFVQGARTTDWPRYRWRGFMIDSGRSPNSLPKIKRIIRICSALKLNFLVFREGDDEMCAVRYRTNRLGEDNPYALTVDDVADLVSYADRYGITVVPEIESLGHSTAKGFHYPDLVNGGFEHDYPGIGIHIRKSHLVPADPRSYALLESIYDEWFSVTRCTLVHLGLDEVRLPAEDQAHHLEGLLPVVEEVARKHGIEATPIVWADAPRTPEPYRDRVIRCLWAYGDDKEQVGLNNPHLVRQGLVELSEPGCAEQVFMAAGSGSLHTPDGKTPYDLAFRNLAQWAMWGNDRPNFVGLLAVQWSGNMLDDWLPDFAAAADVAWNPPESIPDFDSQMASVRAQLFRLKDAASPDPAEADLPAWDGILLRDGEWWRDIRTGKTRDA